MPSARGAVTTVLRPVGNDSAVMGRGFNNWDNSKGCKSNWQCVDDVTSDGDATYVYHTFNKRLQTLAEDAYVMQDLPSQGTIYSITEYVVARVASGTCDTTNQNACIAIALEQARTTWYPACNGGADYYQLTPSYSVVSYTWSTQPCSSAAWTTSAVNAVSLAIQEGGSGATIRVTQVWLEVSWSG